MIRQCLLRHWLELSTMGQQELEDPGRLARSENMKRMRTSGERKKACQVNRLEVAGTE